MGHIHKSFLFFVLLLLSGKAFATLIPERDSTTPLVFHNSLQIVEDKYATFEAFSPQLHQLFLETPPRSPVIGYTDSIWWAQISLENPFPTPETRFLEIEDSGEGMPEIVFFFKNALGSVRKVVSGGLYRHSEDTVENNFIVVPLTLQPHETVTAQIRVKGDAVTIPMHLHTQKSFLVENYHKMAWIGLSYGMLILLTLYNFALFFATRERSYLYYVGFVFFLGLSLTGFDGLSAQFFLRNYPHWNTHLINISACLCAAFLSLFTNHFLRVRRHSLSFSRILQGFALLAVTVAIGNAISKINLVTNIIVTSISLLYFASVFVTYRNQKRLTTIFAIPTLFFIAATLLTTARLASLLPVNFWTLNALRIGIILNALFWSTALSYRIRLVIRESFDSEKTLLEKTKEAEVTKRKNLEHRTALVETLSQKLSGPLSMLLSEIKSLQEKAPSSHPAAHAASQQQTPHNVFWQEWLRQQSLLSVSTQRLSSLAETLQEFDRQHKALLKRGDLS